MGLPQRVQELLARLGLGPRLQLGVLAAASIALLYFVIRWAVAPDWVPAFAGLPLEDVDRIVQRLDEEGIGYRMARGGSQLLVPAPELARARVALAAEGLPADGRPGFELFDQPSWGMTDFTQRINYRRALEGELERTIGKMRGVAGAKIHLTMHETSPFRRANRPAEASVVLRLAGAATPDGSIVRGIALLVASSVDGLVSDNVTVVDDTGRLLSASLEPGSLAGVSARHLEVRRDLERYLESKTEDLVEQVVGPGNSRVRVAAVLNFDRVDRTTESLDADAQVVTEEQKAEIIPGSEEQGAASVQSSVAFLTPRSVERFIGGAGEIERLTVSVLLNEPPAPDGAAASPRTPEDVGRIEALVRNAVGIDDGRGDAITVVSLPFEPRGAGVVAPTGGIGIWERVQMLYRPVVAVIGLALVFLLALRTLRAISSSSGETAPALSGAAGGGSLPGDLRQALTSAGAPDVGAADRDRAIRTAIERPEVVAEQIRAWMREG